jgi:crossover junction endodeoxyribonuclease RusA
MCSNRSAPAIRWWKVKQNSSRRIIIELNHLPPAELSPNARVHWAEKYQAMQDAKAEIGWLAKMQWQGQSPMNKARISYEFHVRDNRTRDYDNFLARCKPFPDGLIEVDVLVYDDTKHLELGSARCIPDSAEKTIIIVEEIDE